MGKILDLGENVAVNRLLNEKPAKRLQIDISPELHSAFKMACQAKGTLMTPILVDFMERWLDQNAPVWMEKPKGSDKWAGNWVAPSKAKK